MTCSDCVDRQLFVGSVWHEPQESQVSKYPVTLQEWSCGRTWDTVASAEPGMAGSAGTVTVWVSDSAAMTPVSPQRLHLSIETVPEAASRASTKLTQRTSMQGNK